ncbi:MAG TPA: hypothetical protein VMU97_01945 [Candidatus Dormibacteraeota bacterium]|nr:hypothetical protein [Candidatus Dormibacteraeota bacterium]
MDKQAAEALADSMTNQEIERIEEVNESLDPGAVALRDQNREKIGAVFRGESDQHLSVKGPCSADKKTVTSELLDILESLDEEHPGLISGIRINGSKPRTQGKWRGLAYSTDPAEREQLHEIMREALSRGRPIISEIADSCELGEFGPYLSGAWLGARDMASTSLRAAASAIHLPFGAKNGMDGSVEGVRNTMEAINMNTRAMEGSGANLGVIASGPSYRGIPTGILPVGEGNNTRAIIARGYALPAGTSPELGCQLAIRHISQLCLLAEELGSVVLIDKTHGAPPMFGIDPKDTERFPKVNEAIARAIESGEIQAADRIRGDIAEISPDKGRTDPNWIVNTQNRQVLSNLTRRAMQAVQAAAL